MDALRRDIRFALRGLARQRGFAAVAVLTLALGVGANAAIFSILYALVLRPLPHPDGERLVSMVADGLEAGALDDWRTGMRSLDALGAFTLGSAVLTTVRPALNVRSMTVSSDLLEMLGARPVRGRSLSAADFEPGARPVALVGPRLWAALGGGERMTDVSVLHEGISRQVVGVLPADFAFMRYSGIDVWLPMAGAGDRRVSAIGRLAVDGTIEEALAQATALSRRLAPDVVDENRLVRVAGVADLIEADVRSPLWILFGAATLVLLIACVNVANLLLSKATGRRAELAVRASLGASRGDLVRQLLTENGVLALLGAAAGLLLAWWTADLLVGLAPEYTPRIDEVGVNGVVLAFTLAVAVAATLAAGLFPALGVARVSTASSALRGTTAGRTALRGRGILVAVELGLALMVLIASGLLIRTFLVLRPASPGFETRDRIVFRATLPSDDPARVDAFMTGLAARVGALEGNPRTAAVTSLPLSGESMVFPVAEVDGRPPVSERPLMIHFRAASPDYMDVISMPVVRGRSLEASDGRGTDPVIVLNENLAGRLWPDGNAVGRSVAFDLPGGITTFTVVGVSADAAIFGGTTGSRPEAFASLRQSAWARLDFVVHSPGRAATAERLRDIAANVDPAVALDDFQTFSSMAAGSVAVQRFQMVLMTVFGALAFALAVIGCYSVLSTTVARRRREIGVRVALGATRVDVVGHVLRSGMSFILGGLGVGMVGALATSRLLAGVLYGVEPTDPATFAVAAAALFATATVAAAIPARHASTVQPAEVLRAD